jgi:hypothetical protein
MAQTAFCPAFGVVQTIHTIDDWECLNWEAFVDRENLHVWSRFNVWINNSLLTVPVRLSKSSHFELCHILYCLDCVTGSLALLPI